MNTKFNDEIYGLLAERIEGIDFLEALALVLLLARNHLPDRFWELDPFLWETTNNTLLVLQTVSWRRLKQQMDDERHL